MTYEGRRFFGSESLEEKTRKYTQPHPIVTTHLRNLQQGFQVASPIWRNALSVKVPALTPVNNKRETPPFNNLDKRKRDFSKVTHKTKAIDNHYGKRQHIQNPEQFWSKSNKSIVESPEYISSKHSEYDKLSSEMLNYSTSHQQSMDLLQKKLNLRSALLSVFRRQFPACSLHLVGSSCNGFATNNSDADFCLMLTHTRQVDQRSEACWYLKQLQKLLKSMSCIRNIQFIRAKVPILKFRDTISGCECDINTNNSIGIRNTHLLRTYSKGFCRPPVLTAIQQEYPQFFSLDRNVDDLPMFEPADLIPCNCSQNQQSLGELLFGFFKYYALEFKWDDLVISIRLGHATPRALNMTWKDAYLCIEEPFDRTNTARAVHEYSKFKFIQNEFKRAYERLVENLSLQNLL